MDLYAAGNACYKGSTSCNDVSLANFFFSAFGGSLIDTVTG